MKRDIKEIIKKMTLEEKASLCSGLDAWKTKAIERLGIPSIFMTDGPHGLRKQSGNSFSDSVPATCFPTASCLASSWDKEILNRVGEALAEECLTEGVSILLGPGVNIKRSPLCGRNFEYFSEDPILSSELAASYIQGVQSKGVGTSIKHYAANNQEHKRMCVDTKVDERTLREIYLASFEKAIKEAKPWTVMAAYNKVNGNYCTQNEFLLNKILREEWEFEGFVVSDWGAVDERVEAIKAGLDLEMPGNGGQNDKKIIEAVKKGDLSEEILDATVERILNIIFKAIDNIKEEYQFDKEKHHKLAQEVAKECIVLLKNENGILPLKDEGKIGIIGTFATQPRFQGQGSSGVKPTKVDIPFEEIKKVAGENVEILYAEGYKQVNINITEDKDESKRLLKEAKEVAKTSDVVIVFAGLPDGSESEGYDREHMKLPEIQNILIEEVVKENKNVIVVLMNGAPIEMPWEENVKGIFECYLGGQGVGKAIADLLFGKANPCGKLAETFPKKLSDNPSYLNFPGEEDIVEYKEGIFVGYRYYDKKEMEVLYPFGYGLSYTKFDYLEIKVDKKQINENEKLKVLVKVKNIGKMAGKEIVQLYVRDVNSSVIRPIKELKGFKKIYLQPGETKELEFELDKRSFAYYDVVLKAWYVEEGDFEILIGSSSRDIKLKETVYVKSEKIKKHKFSRNSLVKDFKDDPKGKIVYEQIINFLKDYKMGEHFGGNFDEQLIQQFLMSIIVDSPLRNFALMFGRGKINEDTINEWLKIANE